MKSCNQVRKSRRWQTSLLAISLTLNIAGVLAGYKILSSRNVPASVPPAVLAPVAVLTGPTAKNQVPSTPAVQTLRWSDLESEDYGIFISRLRQTGCPESTIRDIVRGELLAATADQRQELQTRVFKNPAWRPPAGVTRQDFLAAQFRKLDQQLDINTNALLQQAASSVIESDAASSPAGGASKTQPTPVLYPLSLAGVTLKTSTGTSTGSDRVVSSSSNPAEVLLTPAQIAAVQDNQKKFVQDIGGPNQDPDDPAYADKWRSAESLANQILRGRIGDIAYESIGRAAAVKAYMEQKANAASGKFE